MNTKLYKITPGTGSTFIVFCWNKHEMSQRIPIYMIISRFDDNAFDGDSKTCPVATTSVRPLPILGSRNEVNTLRVCSVAGEPMCDTDRQG